MLGSARRVCRAENGKDCQALTEIANARAIADYVAAAPDRQFPAEVLDAARLCLADWIAVAIGAHDQPAGLAAASVAKSWGTRGKAPMIGAGNHAPAAAALANGTFAHCLDFDDTNFRSLAHLSGPTWASALATAAHEGLDERAALRGFVTGYEVASRLGGNGLGQTISNRGIHSTAVFGRFGAAVAAGCIMGLEPEEVVNALGVAATQCFGLVASFGTMSKPFHAGKAAMDGVLSAELAANGFQARHDLLEPQGDTLAKALVQDGSAGFQEIAFDDGWEILQNTLKPFAACHLTHAAIETAQKLAPSIFGREIAAVEARVHPTVMTFAAKADPRSALEGKFSVAYCTALGLCGHEASKDDFSDERLRDPSVRAVMAKVSPVPDDRMTQTSAAVTVIFADGATRSAETPLASGNPGNPLGWDRMERKFLSLVEPVLETESRRLLDLVRSAGERGSIEEIAAILSTQRSVPGQRSHQHLER